MESIVPKKPLSSYFLYAKKVRPEIKKKLELNSTEPVSVTDVSKQIGIL